MGKVRKQTYTMEMYLEKMRDQDIRSDQDVQRLSDQWNNNMVNELIYTVLSGGYIPPVILGEENNSQMWIIDGLQRSTALMMFRYMNYKITPSIEEPVISYRAKAKDVEGNIKIDGNGDFIWEEKTFDLKRKTFDRLPEELQKKFNEYQIETVIHEGYGMKEISKFVRRYNNHKAMNVAQKAFTFIDNYARRIREILKHDFFIECTGYTKNERKNGTLERVVMETIMATFHLDNWKKSNQMGAYLNENASAEEFDILNANISRLEKVVSDDLYNLFTSKDSFLWFTLFHKFTRTGLADFRFAEFLSAFHDGLCNTEINGTSFYEIDKRRSTKDKAVFMEKLELLETLMCGFLNISRDMLGETDIIGFVRENVDPEITVEDVEEYAEVLDVLGQRMNPCSALMEKDNRPSMTALVAYSFTNDIDLDDWILDYNSRKDSYLYDQKENYLAMRKDLEQFMRRTEAA